MNDFQWAEEMNCAVTVCDCDGVILYQNAPAREIYKCPATTPTRRP